MSRRELTSLRVRMILHQSTSLNPASGFFGLGIAARRCIFSHSSFNRVHLSFKQSSKFFSG
jgi:hypothetical protein